MESRRESCESTSSGHDTVVRTFDAEAGHDISASIVRTVADLRGVDPIDVTPPLGSVVETDAIDSLFPSYSEPDRSLVFEFADCEVSVRGDGRITVRESLNSVTR